MCPYSIVKTTRQLFPNDPKMLRFADFVEEVDDWFDVMNSTQETHHFKPLKSQLRVNLEQQTTALYKLRDSVKNLHVKHTNNSKKAGERVYNESLQPWQHNLIKTSNGMVGLFNDLKIKYDEPNDEVGSSFSIPTTKFNQALLKISISGFL